jgi:BirA family transcriptional regulator, biotin operon repressor / biotin---[acetyl-CoA-carboxylase] ligase
MTDDTQIETLLRERTRFRHLRHVASCPSTQDLALEQPRDASGRLDEAVFWADHQTRGRGRQQREWHDEPAADLAVTFRVHAILPKPLELPAALPVAVALACEPLAGVPLRFKWPNDVFLHGRKLCGVLIDAGTLGPNTYLIGVGINCNRVRFPPDLEHASTSLALTTGHEVNRAQLLLELATQIDAAITALVTRRHEALEAVFRDRLGLLGRRVRVENNEVHEGVVHALTFTHLELDGGRTIPLATVRSIRA